MKQTDPALYEDQTRFATEEPMFESVGGYPEDENVQKKVVQPFFKRKGAVVGLIAGSTILILLLLFLVNVIILRERVPKVPEPSPVAVTDNKQNIPLLDRVTELNQELKDADPNQPQLVFPAVDLELTLDDVKKQ